MKLLGIVLSLIFLALVAVYFFIFMPEKYEDTDLYDEILHRGKIKVGINTDSKPFGFMDKEWKIVGYDADLAHYMAQYILKNPDAVEFYPVTPANRMLKVSTGELDMVIATVTITPQRQEIINFSAPYDYAGQALLVRSNSKIKSLADLSGQNVGVVFGTTAEKNMLALAPDATVIGFRNYRMAYEALKAGKIDALTSDDTILSTFAFEDKTVKLLPKRYTREPYGIALRKGKGTQKLKENVDFAIGDMKQKNVINRMRRKWGL